MLQRTASVGCRHIRALLALLILSSGTVRAQILPPAVEPDLPFLPLPPVPGFEQEPHKVLQPGTTPLPIPRPVEAGPAGPIPKLDPSVILPDGSSIALPETTKQLIRFGPRYGKLNDYVIDPIGEDMKRLTYSGGLIVNVVYLSDKPGVAPQEVEFATDNAVIWIKGIKGGIAAVPADIRADRAPDKKDDKVSVEVYMSGNVVVRTRSSSGGIPSEQVLRADELYYDLDKSKAIAMSADLETKFQNGLDPIHIRGREIWRLGQHEWQAFDTLIFSSKRPADPALTMSSKTVNLVEEDVVRKNIFGRPYRNTKTGELDMSTQRNLTAEHNRVELLGLPIFVIPKYQADLEDPAGPLSGLGFRNDRVFGFQTYSSWDMYKLFALRGPPSSRWVVNADYLSQRGVGLGTDFDYNNIFGNEQRSRGNFSAYGLNDNGTDNLGSRPTNPGHPFVRSRIIWTHSQDLFESGSNFTRFMGQAAYLSDMNFYEQFYKLQFDSEQNQETFAYLYGARGNFAWSALAEGNIHRPWVTETSWLPKVDAALVGQTFFDKIVYTGRASVGYGLFRPATQDPVSTMPTEAAQTDTMRTYINQRVSIPIDLGPFRLQPYANGDLAYYSRDLDGNSLARAYGGIGTTLSIPFSKLYPEVNSEMFNLRGINHKMEYRLNYYKAVSDQNHNQLPLMDRVNDDQLDFTYRNWRTGASALVPGPLGVQLQTSPIYDPQVLAIRRLVDNRSEMLDSLQVVQAGIYQRWQTKRGVPGADHTVDYMALDLTGSYYPDMDRDNFGAPFGLLEYNYLWNIGDRTAITSSGWVDPFEGGTRYFNVNSTFTRPDGTALTIGYRHTDPLGSRAVIGILNYQLTRKYSIAVSNVYDFGTKVAQSTTFLFNRTGPDVTVSLGFTYNAFVNNFGLQFLIMPNGAVANRGQRFQGNGYTY